MKKILLLSLYLTMLISTIFSLEKIRVLLEPQLQSDGDLYLYRIFLITTNNALDYRDAIITINDTNFYCSDLLWRYNNVYVGRDRKEPFLWLKEDDLMTIELKDGFTQNLSVKFTVPGIMSDVISDPIIKPDEVITETSYTFSWAETGSDQYKYMVTNNREGKGNSITENKITIEHPYEWIHAQFNTQNSAELSEGDLILIAKVDGPKPFMTQSYQNPIDLNSYGFTPP